MPLQRATRSSKHSLQRLAMYDYASRRLYHSLASRLDTDTAMVVLKATRAMLEKDVLVTICDWIKKISHPHTPQHIRQVSLCSLSTQLAAHRNVVIQMYLNSKDVGRLFEALFAKLYTLKNIAESFYAQHGCSQEKRIYTVISRSLLHFEKTMVFR